MAPVARSSNERIARIEERLDNFIEEVRRDREESKAERAVATNHRQQVLDGMNTVNNTVRQLATEVAVIKPFATDYKEKMAEGRGVVRAAGWLRLVFGIVVSVVATALGMARYGQSSSP